MLSEGWSIAESEKILGFVQSSLSDLRFSLECEAKTTSGPDPGSGRKYLSFSNEKLNDMIDRILSRILDKGLSYYKAAGTLAQVEHLIHGSRLLHSRPDEK